MQKIKISCLIIAVLCLANAAFAENRIIVKLAKGLDTLPDFGVVYSEISSLNPPKNDVYLLILEDAGEKTAEEALKILNGNPAVKIAELDSRIELKKAPK